MKKKFSETVPSRKILPSIDKQAKNESKESGSLFFIVLAKGEDLEGYDFWAYLAIPQDKYEAYCYAEASGSFDLEEYGEVLAYGHGTEPPEDERQRMMDTYKLDENFEENLELIRILLLDE